jgi:hypothetical protein
MTARTKSLVAVAALCLSAALRVAPPASARGLDGSLVRQAPEILRHLRKRGYRNVGVLEFAVEKEAGRRTASAGLVDLDLARRLEVALILAEDVAGVVGVIQNAGARAARIKGANLRTEEGRQRFFARRYQLAWGPSGATVKAGAFLTGVVRLGTDLRYLRVIIRCFDDKGKVEVVARFRARAGANELVRGGASFLLRGRRLSAAAAADSAARVKNGDEPHPLDPRAKPLVLLQICYNDKPIPLNLRGGQARVLVPVREPGKRQKVTFVLRRTAAAGRRRLAVVLKVNGENTLYRQRLPDLDCAKWVLNPGRRPMVITGFQENDRKAREFAVLSRAESKEREASYGKDVGTVCLAVYREKESAADEPEEEEEDEEEAAVVARAVYPKERAANVSALREQFRDQAGKVTLRGVIVSGKKRVGSPVKRVPFRAYPIPVQAATVLYYRPAGVRKR